LPALCLALLVGLSGPALAQGRSDRAAPAGEPKQAPSASEQKQASSPGVLKLLPADAVSEHSITVNGEKISYTATAGTLDLFAQSGERTAAIFYTAYVRNDERTERRPLTFAFNGGPGAASAYLHLGVVGPKVVVFGSDGRDGANAQLRENPATWLPFTDLVLIDPIDTGWSRAAKPDEAKNFQGVRADAQMLAKTIALYVARNARTASPKYILGESYGGFRAVKVARALQEEQGIVVSGIVALSPLLEGALNFNASRFALGAALQLPSLAAAELERRRAFTPAALAEAEHFAMTEYLTTLAGPPPEGEKARAFYARVAQITGLPVDLVTRQRGFVRETYVKHARAASGDVVSPYDASFAVPDPFPEADAAHNDDPVLDGFTRALGGLFVGYARQELGFKTELTYTLLATGVSQKWDWHGAGESRANASVTSDIRELLALNPAFRLVVAHGTSDLVTPYGVSRYVVDHLPKLGADRVQLKLYRGGHMFYFDPASRAAFTNDMKAFYSAATE
jgi:carboxypeptidase C (cathepsin A)